MVTTIVLTGAPRMQMDVVREYAPDSPLCSPQGTCRWSVGPSSAPTLAPYYYSKWQAIVATRADVFRSLSRAQSEQAGGCCSVESQ